MFAKLISYIIFIALIFTCSVSAQVAETSSILISTSSVTQIPADEIYFTVVLSTEDADPQKAFEDHKTLEKNLLNIFSEFEFADSNISYSLLNINNTHPKLKDKPLYRTRQVVNVKFNDFNKYEPFQLALLSKGIYNFRAKFISGGADEWLEKGIQEAVLNATREAEMTAKSSGKKLGKIVGIESSHYYPSESNMSTALTTLRPGESLIELPHYVQMRVSLRVRFELLDEE
ncbi:hypothetical protein BMS3Abin03_01337 [bacterium BMS3Abin03]|nr:hypothetical protein BMS3Abin03_01337 [bacterium BMS3Abin03]